MTLIFIDLMMPVLEIFIPVLRKIREMTCQNSGDYVFDCSTFCRRFSFTPTNPEDAV